MGINPVHLSLIVLIALFVGYLIGKQVERRSAQRRRHDSALAKVTNWAMSNSSLVGGDTRTNIMHAPAGTTMRTFCKGFDRWSELADGKGGVTEVLVIQNTVECGAQPEPPMHFRV